MNREASCHNIQMLFREDDKFEVHLMWKSLILCLKQESQFYLNASLLISFLDCSVHDPTVIEHEEKKTKSRLLNCVAACTVLIVYIKSGIIN